MNETAFAWVLDAIVTDQAIGNALAAAFANDADDPTMFNRASPLRAVGAGGAATAWTVSVPCVQSVNLAVQEFNTAGPTYPLLNARGISDQQVAFAKTKVVAACTPKAEWAASAFVAANGYEYVY